MTINYAASGFTGSRTSLLPSIDAAELLAWDSRQAKQRGVYGFDSRDVRSRPFNLLRSRLLKLHRAKGWRLFGIVSATPGVGKSFIATNLSAALSRSPEVQTTLVDLDLRRGSVAENFGSPDRSAVRDFLEGTIDTLAGSGFRPDGESLVVIPTDNSRTHSAELLSGPRMRELADAMRAEPANSIFICDLPPVFANDDAAIVTAMLDAFVIVVEEGSTTKKQVRDSLSILDQAPCAGAILNRFNGGLMSDTYGYGYGSGGAYAKYYA